MDRKVDTNLPSHALLVKTDLCACNHSTAGEEGYVLETSGHGGWDRYGGRPLGAFTEEAPEVGLEG